MRTERQRRPTRPCFSPSAICASARNQPSGPPKSASEGAERDRTWPAIVPKKSGEVQNVSADRLRVLMDAEDGGRPRTQTYKLRVKIAYVRPGDRFVGAPRSLPAHRGGAQPVDLQAQCLRSAGPLGADSAVDRYAAVKSLPFRPDLKRAVSAIERRLDVEGEERVLLEAAGAGTALGSAKALDKLAAILWSQERADLRMEAVLILTELRAPGAREILNRVATDPRFEPTKSAKLRVGIGKGRAAAIWDLLPFISDPDRDVALHAIVGFGDDADAEVIDRLIADLLAEDHCGRRPPPKP